MLNERKSIGYVVITVMFLVLGTVQAKDVKVLDRQLSDLIEDFNQQSDKVKLFFIVGPTCPVCQKGLKKMKNDVLANIPQGSDLAIFAVHVPALDAEQKDISETYALFDDQRAVHYWDEMGTSGIRFQRTLELPSYAWDVWMIYQPREKWEQKDPPKPLRWWHQLKGVDPINYLNSKELSNTLITALAEAKKNSAGLK